MSRQLRVGDALFSVEARREGRRLLSSLEGEPREFEILAETRGQIALRIGERIELLDFAREGAEVWIAQRGTTWRLRPAEEPRGPGPRGSLARGGASGPAGAEGSLRSPMPALVSSVEVGEGEEVEGGRGLLSLEAMKMETRIAAPPGSWRVRRLLVAAGQRVARDQVLIELEARGGEGGLDVG